MKKWIYIVIAIVVVIVIILLLKKAKNKDCGCKSLSAPELGEPDNESPITEPIVPVANVQDEITIEN